MEGGNMKGKYGVIFAVLGIIVFFTIKAQAADWKFVCKGTDGDNWFYDTQSVLRGQETVKVWVKDLLSDKRKKDYIKGFSKTPGIENISYILNRDELNCSKNIFRVLSIVCYSSEGKVIYNEDYPDEQFIEVAPDSHMAGLIEFFCKEGKGGK
jgi:hypothetical protein